ncbi:MAG: M48 family metalloprotease [Actinomycetia bacterium]|nr:M48 family metalloprotease [Actinomycetes bacterium]
MNRPDPDLIKANHSLAQRFTVVVFLVPLVVLTLLFWLVFPWWLAIVFSLVLAAGYVAWRLGGAEQRLASAVGGSELAEFGEPHLGAARLANLVEGLAASAGVREPSLYLIDDPALNALVVGRSDDRACLMVTTGMVDALERVELEAVVAQLLVQIRTADVVPRTVGAALLAPLASVVPGLYSRAIGSIVDRDRRFRNDALGASVTRYPPGLVAAYERINSANFNPASSPQVAAHLWLVGNGSASSTHPATETRIAALREL